MWREKSALEDAGCSWATHSTQHPHGYFAYTHITPEQPYVWLGALPRIVLPDLLVGSPNGSRQMASEPYEQAESDDDAI